MAGYVYLLTNPSLPGLVKIGRTDRDPFARAAELQTTGVPTPFEVLAALRVLDSAGVESRVHQRLEAQRVSGGREFFRLSLEAALHALYEEGRGDVGGTADADPAAPPTLAVPPRDSVEEALRLFEPGETSNPAAGHLMMERLAKRGDPQACLFVARSLIYLVNGYVKQNQRAKVYRLLAVAAEASLPEAFYLLGITNRNMASLERWLRCLPERERADGVVKTVRWALMWNTALPDVFAEDMLARLHAEILDILWAEKTQPMPTTDRNHDARRTYTLYAAFVQDRLKSTVPELGRSYLSEAPGP